MITTLFDNTERISIVVDGLAQSIVDFERANLGGKGKVSKRMHFTFVRMHLYEIVMRGIVTGTLYPRQKGKHDYCPCPELLYILNCLDDTSGGSTDVKSMAEEYYLAAGAVLDNNVDPQSSRQRSGGTKKPLTSLLLSFSELGPGDKFVVILIFYAANMIRNIKRKVTPIPTHNGKLVESPSCGNSTTHRRGYMFLETGREEPADISCLKQFMFHNGHLSLENILLATCKCEIFATGEYDVDLQGQLDFYDCHVQEVLRDSSDDDGGAPVKGLGINAKNGSHTRRKRSSNKKIAETTTKRKRYVIAETESETEGQMVDNSSETAKAMASTSTVVKESSAKLVSNAPTTHSHKEDEDETAQIHSLSGALSTNSHKEDEHETARTCKPRDNIDFDVDFLNGQCDLPSLGSPTNDGMSENIGDGSHLYGFDDHENGKVEVFLENILRASPPNRGEDNKVYEMFAGQNINYVGCDMGDNEDKDDDGTKEGTTVNNTYKDDNDDNEHKDDGTTQFNMTVTNDLTNEVATPASSAQCTLSTGTSEILAITEEVFELFANQSIINAGCDMGDNKDKDDDGTKEGTTVNNTYKDDNDDNEHKDDGTTQFNMTVTNDVTNEVTTLASSTQCTLSTGTSEILAGGTPSNVTPPADVYNITQAAKDLCSLKGFYTEETMLDGSSSLMIRVIHDGYVISDLKVENQSLRYLLKWMLPLTKQEEEEVNDVIEPTWDEKADPTDTAEARSEVIYRSGNDTLTAECMSWLRDGYCLDDSMITFYLKNVLALRDRLLFDNTKNLYHSPFFLQSLFDEYNNDKKLRGKYNYKNVKGWTRGNNFIRRCIFDMNYIICPYNHKNTHWSVGIISVKEKRVYWYDSKGGHNSAMAEGLMEYVRDEYKEIYNEDMDDPGWRVICSEGSPQRNGECNYTYPGQMFIQ